MPTRVEDEESNMPSYRYLIVGGGTADAAVRGIREVDPNASVGLIGAEIDPPYDRPPLSKGLWKGKPLASIWRGTKAQGVDLPLGRTAKTLEPHEKRVTDEEGVTYTFEKLLLATGGTPRRLRIDDDPTIYFRTVEDYRRLHRLSEQGERFGVLGGGFIGSEIAAALAMNGKGVAMVFPGEVIGGHVFPRELGLFLNDFYRRKGIQVLAGQAVTDIERRGGRLVMRIGDRQEIEVDGVVAGIGMQPNVELAATASLKISNGIVVDSLLRTSHPDIYAAGDVAAFHNPALARRIRVEHEDNANTMGRCAGRNMAGEATPYHHLPSFYSDLFDLGYEAVGDLDARLATVANWQEPFRKGVVYYLEKGRVRGVLLWNIWQQVDAERRLIAQPGPFSAADLEQRVLLPDATAAAM
jgi:NADPH-dependent 2,4-dienoyl-CoA reductase/sulfur reductase-like enzyme